LHQFIRRKYSSVAGKDKAEFTLVTPLSRMPCSEEAEERMENTVFQKPGDYLRDEIAVDQ
jgi:hypothetical protein